MNSFKLLGVVYKDVTTETTKNGGKVAYIYLETERPYKSLDKNGKQIKDRFKIATWNTMAEEVKEKIKVGDLLSVSGRLKATEYEKNGKTSSFLDMQVEKISYLKELDGGSKMS